MGLLVEAYERCRGPEDEGETPLDRAGLKALVREIDLWCSSCMVALEGGHPVGVLLGAKRPDATLIHALRVRPDHRRRGHGRHLLVSLGQKLAILGPPRLVAEVPADRDAGRALFAACGWREEGTQRDWFRPRREPASGASADPSSAIGPIGIDQARASGLLDGATRAWRRDPAALGKEGDRLAGLGFSSTDRLEALFLYRPGRRDEDAWEVLAASAAPGELGGTALRLLLAELDRLSGGAALRFERVAPGEVDSALLTELGFEPGAAFVRYAGEAKAA